MKKCLFCTNDFKPIKSTQKYCGSSCRVKAFNVQKNANLTPNLTPNNDMINEQINAKKREWVANNIEAYLLKKREAYKKRQEKKVDNNQ